MDPWAWDPRNLPCCCVREERISKASHEQLSGGGGKTSQHPHPHIRKKVSQPPSPHPTHAYHVLPPCHMPPWHMPPCHHARWHKQ
eukprot:10880179-Lingulodinium_polyedra.AAC.1